MVEFVPTIFVVVDISDIVLPSTDVGSNPGVDCSTGVIGIISPSQGSIREECQPRK